MGAVLGRLGVLALLVLTWLACWWAQVSGGLGPAGLGEVTEGAEVTVTLYEVGELQPPDRYRVRRGGIGIDVLGSTDGLRVGDELTVHGTIRNGLLVEAWRDEAPLRAAKKRLGFLGLALVGVVGWATLRWRRAGIDLRG